MTVCEGCGGEFEAAELTRHERGGLLIVHCPDCGRTLGTWRDPSLRRRGAGEPD